MAEKPIFFNSQAKFTLVDRKGSEKKFVATSQSVGLLQLRNFFNGLASYSDIFPFIVNNIDSYRRQYVIHIGNFDNRGAVSIDLGANVEEIVKQQGTIVALPKEDENAHYQWIDFYTTDSLNPRVISEQPISSVRVFKDALSFRKKSWFGPERQLFIDHLSGEKDIDFLQLKEFKIPVPAKHDKLVIFKKQVGPRNNKKLQYSISLAHSNLDPYRGQIITCRPRRNDKYGYTWLEGLVDEPEGEKILFSRKFYKGDPKLYEWQGVDKQSITDWIEGRLPFESINPISFRLGTASKTINLAHSDESYVSIGLSNRNILSQNDIITLVPCKDELYEWVEVYFAKSSQPQSRYFLTSLRVIRDRYAKLDGHWPGPERQRYLDFLDRKLTYLELPIFEITVDKGIKDISLFTYKSKTAGLSLGSKLTPGQKEIFEVVPIESPLGDLVIELRIKRKGISVGRYKFDRNIGRFALVDDSLDRVKMPYNYWTEGKIEEEARMFVIEHGNLTEGLLEEFGKSDLRAAIGKKYPGRIKGLKEKLGLPQYRQKEMDISPEDANAILESFVE